MIAYLKGKIIVQKSNFLIIDVSGIGYKVYVCRNHPIKEINELFIHHHVKEDIEDLYGFDQLEEKELFEQLILANGVGPKLALTIMSNATVENIKSAIINSNTEVFESIPGIGKRMAAKIIIELKNKITDLDNNKILLESNDSNGLVDALVSLGYKKVEIFSILNNVPADKNLESQVKWCLKNLAK